MRGNDSFIMSNMWASREIPTDRLAKADVYRGKSVHTKCTA